MYEPAFPRYKHQDEALDRLFKKPSYPAPSDVFCWNMEQGTGKSKVIADEFGIREDAKDLRNIVIVAPNGVVGNWEFVELPMHLSNDLKQRTTILRWRSGGGVGFKNSVRTFLRNDQVPRVFIVNVEAMSSVQAAVDLCAEMMRQRRTMMVIDESTRIRGLSDKTERARIVIELGKLAYARRIASGLLTPRSPLDLFSQFEFLDYRILGHQSYYSFRSKYAILQKNAHAKLARYADGKVMVDSDGNAVRTGGHFQVVGYRYIDELREKINPYRYRVLKKDCLDLPPKIYLPPRLVELTSEQERILKELKITAMSKLENGAIVSVKNKLGMLLRMHQVICGHVGDEKEKEQPVPSKRIQAMLEVLDEQEGKAIIWSGFRYSLKEIIAVLKKEYGPKSTVDFYGDTKTAARDENKRRFQQDPECRFFVSNQSTGGWGNTLTAASLVLYYSNTWDLEQREQSEDRPHRAGLDHPVTYVDLTCGHAVEKRLIKCLREKMDLAASVQGDSFKEWIA